MIKVLFEESYEWLLDIKDIKEKYIQRYIESYLEELLNISIDITDNQIQFDLESSSLFGSIRNILDSGDNYKIIKITDDIDTLFNKVYRSIDCKYPHELTLIGDLENYNYSLSISILSDNLGNYISDQDLINLYNEDDSILLSLIGDLKKGSVRNAKT